MRVFNEKFGAVRIWVIRNKKEIRLILIILILVVVSEFALSQLKSPISEAPNLLAIVPSIKPTDTPFTTYTKPVIAKSERYDIYLVGDSMVHAFGPRGGQFNEILSRAFPGTFFEISNYAEANQSILLLPARLKEPVQAEKDLKFDPIMEGRPHLIIIESFGYNPLSQFGKEEGLKKQEEVLTEVMTTLTNHFPNTAIMFLAAIAPDKKTYGKNISHATPDERWAQAEERIEYITNHIDYAREHNIPLINAYEESLDAQGDGDTKYINPDDNIHPSAEGLALMGRVMTRRIQEENIFPNPE